jgi:DNA-binding MarR family transcriptional regulator
MQSRLPVSPSVICTECFCLGLKRAARAMARRYDDAMRPLDLNNGQFAILTTIAGYQAAGVQALAEQLAMDRTTLTAALKPLERRGLVQVTASAVDARCRDVTLTDAGRALLIRAMPVWLSLQKKLTSELGDERAASFRGQLGRMA